MTSGQTDPNRLVEAYNLVTGVVAQIPAVWIGDPVLGREWAKTPAQAAYDGDLPDRPTSESTIKEIEKYAEVAGIDLTGAKDKDAKLVVVDQAFARHGDAQTVQAGMVPVEVPPPPAGAPFWVDPTAPADEPSDESDVESTDQGAPPTTDTPSTSGNPAGNTTQES